MSTNPRTLQHTLQTGLPRAWMELGYLNGHFYIRIRRYRLDFLQ